jgi:hypothetical protein
MTPSFIELNPPDVQGKVHRRYGASALSAGLIRAGAETGDDTLWFGNKPEGLVQHPLKS